LFRAQAACFRHFAPRIFLRNIKQNALIFIVLNITAVPKSGDENARIGNP